MKKKLFKAIDFTNDEFDWTPPVELPTIVKSISSYDELVSQGMEFVKEDIVIVEKQLEYLEDTSNQFLDCLHIASPDNGKLYDRHRKSAFLILDKIKYIRETLDFMKLTLKNTTQ